MNIWLVWWKDKDTKIVQDIVAISDYQEACMIKRDFGQMYGRKNVSFDMAIIDELPSDLTTYRAMRAFRDGLRQSELRIALESAIADGVK